MTQRQPIQLLQIVPEKLPTFRADVAALFGRYLPRLGVHCSILGKAGEASQNSTGFTEETRVPWHGPRILSELRFAFAALKKVITVPRTTCDIIQVRDMVTIGMLVWLIARLRGLPFVYWMSFLMTEGRIENAEAAAANGRPIKAWLMLAKARLEAYCLYRLLLPNANHVFVQSEAMARYVQARLPKQRTLTPVPMGVDLEAIDHALQPCCWPGWEDKKVIAYLGTLDKMRRIDVLIEALSLVMRQHPDARLLLIGTGTETDVELISNAAKQFGVTDAVAVTGWRPSREAWAYLKAAKLAVSPIPRTPILDTGSPTKLLEYLAFGLPAVGNDNPDQQQVLDGSNSGWLCGSRASDYAQAIAIVLGGPEAARLRASNGPRYIARYRSYAAIADNVATAYRGLKRT